MIIILAENKFWLKVIQIKIVIFITYNNETKQKMWLFP